MKSCSHPVDSAVSSTLVTPSPTDTSASRRRCNGSSTVTVGGRKFGQGSRSTAGGSRSAPPDHDQQAADGGPHRPGDEIIGSKTSGRLPYFTVRRRAVRKGGSRLGGDYSGC